jgi:DNA-binding response OmpR family regulator
MMHVLVVEDDPKLGRLLCRMLERDRHVVDLAIDAESAIEYAQMTKALDAVILDVGLPDRSGLEVARQLRRDANPAGILMLTARDSIADRIAGLDAGADDYLVKPFSYEELAARLRALGRRPRTPRRGGPGLLSVGPIVLDEIRHEVAVDDHPISLTAQEFAVLETLMRQAGRALSREELMDRAWPLGSELTQNAVEASVHRVRERLGPAGERIETVRGVGYRLRDR